MKCHEIQRRLFSWCMDRKHLLALPNFYLYHECDLLSITAAKQVYEYEIKISVADFRVDARKPKHRDYLSSDPIFRLRTPNYFFYVVPDTLLPKIWLQVPRHAGVCAVSEFGKPKIIKVAPRLHDTPVSEKVLLRAARSLMFRYWQLNPRFNDDAPVSPARSAADRE